jgi:hypothetical protein
MRLIWRKHGLTLHGIAEDGLDELILALLGKRFMKIWDRFKAEYIFGLEDIPVQKWLPSALITVKIKEQSKQERIKLQLGMRYI